MPIHLDTAGFTVSKSSQARGLGIVKWCIVARSGQNAIIAGVEVALLQVEQIVDTLPCPFFPTAVKQQRRG